MVHGVRALWSACDVVITVLGARAASVRKGAETAEGGRALNLRCP